MKRFFSTSTAVTPKHPETGRPLETWEEIDLNAPKIPTLDGYERPKGAPLPSDITREQYHRFMKGKPQRFTREFKAVMAGLSIFCFYTAEMAFSIYKLKPDDFEWIEEERDRARKAKDKIDRRIARMEAQKEAQQNSS